jgi:hypothetical protein
MNLHARKNIFGDNRKQITSMIVISGFLLMTSVVMKRIIKSKTQ